MPTKDQCDLCNKFENSNSDENETMKEQIEYHLKNKILSREVKDLEKTPGKSSSKCCVSNFDLQQVLVTPHFPSSQLFYRRKLATYNLTIYDIAKKKGYCYMWREGVGKRGSTNIASCLWKYISN